MSRPDVVSTWRWDGRRALWTTRPPLDPFQQALADALVRPIPDHPDRQGLPDRYAPGVVTYVPDDGPIWPGDRLRAGLLRIGRELGRCLPYLVMLAGAAATVLTSTGWRGGVVLMVLGATVAITAEVRDLNRRLARDLVDGAVRLQLAQRGITVQEEGDPDGTR